MATLQNGWGNANVLAATVPAERLVVGVTYEGAMVEAPAVVRHTGSGPTFVGPYLDGEDAGPAARFATLLRSGGFAAEATPSVKTEIWRKLIHNSACLPVAALTGLRAAELVMAGPACNLVDALTREAVAIARAVGHEITIEERIERIHTVLSAAGNGVPSMLADVIALARDRDRPDQRRRRGGRAGRWPGGPPEPDDGRPRPRSRVRLDASN